MPHPLEESQVALQKAQSKQAEFETIAKDFLASSLHPVELKDLNIKSSPPSVKGSQPYGVVLMYSFDSPLFDGDCVTTMTIGNKAMIDDGFSPDEGIQERLKYHIEHCTRNAN